MLFSRAGTTSSLGIVARTHQGQLEFSAITGDSDDRGAARLNAAAPTAPCRCAACSSSCSPRAFVEHGALRSCLRPRRSCRITPNWRPRTRLRDKTFRMCMRYDRALTSHTTPGSGTTKPRHHRFFLAAPPEPQLELNEEPARGRGTYSLPSTCARSSGAHNMPSMFRAPASMPCTVVHCAPGLVAFTV